MKFKYRHRSASGEDTAQAEMNRRRGAGERGFLWRCDEKGGDWEFVESC
jgi:hypothetical protein